MRISDWSSDVCSSDLSGVDIEQIDPRLVVVIAEIGDLLLARAEARRQHEEAAIGEEAMVGAILVHDRQPLDAAVGRTALGDIDDAGVEITVLDRKSTRLNSSH